MEPLEKRELQSKLEKLELEKRQLNSQLAPRVEVREWLKIVTVPVAALGLIWTIWLGINQAEQGRLSREDERFDRAVTRLAAAEPKERLAGIAGLTSFLGKEYRGRHAATLASLINAVSVEDNHEVRAALLAVLTDLSWSDIDPGALASSLKLAVKNNRALIAETNKPLYKIAFDSPESVTENPGYADQLFRLRVSSKIIEALLRNGARIPDLSGIYCTYCDLSGETLSGTKFDKALLLATTFRNADLRGSSFDGANLMLTVFVGARLQDTKFTDHQGKQYILQYETSPERLHGQEPNFSCSDLTGADFSGLVLFGMAQEKPNQGLYATYPILYKAKIKDANFEDTGIYVLLDAPANAYASDIFGLLPFEGGGETFAYLERERGQNQVLGRSMSGGRFGHTFRLTPSVNSFSGGFGKIVEQFTSAEGWEQAKLPGAIRTYIKEHPRPVENGPDCAEVQRGQDRIDEVLR